MPIRDHFRPPVEYILPWPSLHSGWLAEIAARLNEHLPAGFVALDRIRIDGGVELDVAALEGNDGGRTTDPGSVGTATLPAVYSPPPALGSCSFRFPDVAEVRVFADEYSRTLVGAVELVSPRNKDRPAARDVFIGKCLDYLAAGVSVLVVDVVTDRQAVLHNEIARRLAAPAEVELPDEPQLYAASYRPTVKGKQTQIEFWVNPIELGQELPTVPLRVVGNYFVPVELEMTYTEACRRRKFIP